MLNKELKQQMAQGKFSVQVQPKEESTRLSRTQRKLISAQQQRQSMSYEQQKRLQAMELEKYEQELREYEEQKALYQEQEQRIKNEEADWEYAKRLIFSGKAWTSKGDNSANGKITSLKYKVKYLQEKGYKSGEEIAELRKSNQRLSEENEQQFSEFKKEYPQEKIIRDLKGNVIGVRSGTFGQSLSLEEYKKKIEEYEEQIETPEQQVTEWKTEVAKKPYMLNYRPEPNAIASDKRITSKLSYTQFYPTIAPTTKSKVEQPIKNQDSNIFKTMSNIYNSIPSGTLYLNPANVGLNLNTMVSPFPSQNAINLPKLKSQSLENINLMQQDLFTTELKRKGIKDKFDKEFQELYQASFERKYQEKIIKGDIDFETAKKEFSESAEAEQINKKYSDAIKKARAGTFTGEGFGIAGLELAKIPVYLTPTTPKGAVVEGALLYTGYKGLTKIPTAVWNAVNFGFGTYGTAVALSPTKSPEEKAGGVITAGLSFGSLGYQAYKYARTPTVKTKDILIEKSLTSAQEKGLIKPESESRILRDVAGNFERTDYYKTLKNAEQVIQGRRTVVSTKWRDFLGLDPIYQGVPTKQKGTTYVLQRLGGTQTYTTESAYQKAFKLLVERNKMSEADVTKALRYYQPKDIIYNYKGYLEVTSGTFYKNPVYKIKGTRDIIYKSRVLDDTLGIQTARGTRLKEYIAGTGEILGETKYGTLYKTNFDIQKMFLTDKGNLYQKLNQIGKTTTRFGQVTLSTDKGEQIATRGYRYGDAYIYRENPYDLFEDKNIFRRIIPKGKRGLSIGETAVFKGNVPEITQDISDIRGITVTPDYSRVKQVTDISKLKDAGYMKEVLKTLRSVYGTPAKTTSLTYSITSSAPSGSPSISIKPTTAVTSTLSPPLTETASRIKDITKTITNSKSLTAVAGTTALSSASAQAFKPSFRSVVESKLIEREVLKSFTALDTATEEKQKYNQKLDTGMKSSLKIITGITPIVEQTPFYYVPQIPKTPKPPTPKLIFGFGGDDKLKQLLLKRKKKSTKIVGLLPDFTSRALGLEPKQVSLKQALKEMNKIQTGLETRRGIRIKGYTPINEKSLLKGIMK